MNNAFAMIYARQGDPRLGQLIELRSVSALPLAGRYRIIDVLLSNLTNSGVRSVGLITQRNYKSLMDHIGSGKEWGLSKKTGGLMILPPYDLSTGSSLYRGLSDALLDKRDFIAHQRWRYCLLLATNQVYRQDYNKLMERHLETGADITVLYTCDDRLMHDNTGGTAYFKLDGDRIVDVSTAVPPEPNGYGAGLQALIIDKDLLIYLLEDACSEGRYNFELDVLAPAIDNYKVIGVEHEGYVGRVDSVQAYFNLNQDMLDQSVRNDLFDPHFPVYTKTMDAPPSRFARGCEIVHSLFGTGCDISGHVKNSIVFRGVHIAQTANVENCIIMQNTYIGEGAKLRNMILDKDIVVEPGARLVSVPYDPKIIRKGAVVEGTKR